MGPRNRKNRKNEKKEREPTEKPPPPNTSASDPLDGTQLPEFTTASISLLPDFVAQIGTRTADEAVKSHRFLLRELQELFEELQLSSSEAVQYTDFLDFVSGVQHIFGIVKVTKTLIFEQGNDQEPEAYESAYDEEQDLTGSSHVAETDFYKDDKGATQPTEPPSPRLSELEERPGRQFPAIKMISSVPTSDYSPWEAATFGDSQKQNGRIKPRDLSRVWGIFDPSMADDSILAGSKEKVKDYMYKAQTENIPVTYRVVSERLLIGFVYLTSGKAGVKTLIRDPVDTSTPSPCFNIGAALFPAERGWGYARIALTQALELAFGELAAHRVQAHVLDGPLKMAALKMLNELSFTYEGTQRRALYSPFFADWKDVTTLAVLDTDWMVHRHLVNLGKTVPGRNLELWDALFERQEQERATLLKQSDASMD